MYVHGNVGLKKLLQPNSYCRVGKTFYCISNNKKFYCLNVIPTGGKRCTSIAQCLITATTRLSNAQSMSHQYVDNVRFASNDPTLITQSLEKFYATAAHYNITINENLADQHPAQKGCFLGVEYQMVCGKWYVNVRQRTVAKLHDARQVLTSQPSLRTVMSVFGKLVWCSSILQINIAHFYHCFKFLRRRCGWHLDSSANLWRSTIPEWFRWIELVLQNTSRTVEPTRTHLEACTVITDASLSGFGALAFHFGKVVGVVAGSWETRQHNNINVLEIPAVEYALQMLRLPSPYVHIIVDNTSAMWWLRKRRANSFFANLAIRRIPNGIKILSINYISSMNNPADALSRLYDGNLNNDGNFVDLREG